MAGPLSYDPSSLPSNSFHKLKSNIVKPPACYECLQAINVDNRGAEKIIGGAKFPAASRERDEHAAGYFQSRRRPCRFIAARN